MIKDVGLSFGENNAQREIHCGLCCPWFFFPFWFLPGSVLNAQVVVYLKMPRGSF